MKVMEAGPAGECPGHPQGPDEGQCCKGKAEAWLQPEGIDRYGAPGGGASDGGQSKVTE